MEYGPPPLFRQGISARIRFIFYVVISIVLILIDGRLRTLESFRSTIVSFTTPVVQLVSMPFESFNQSEGYFVSKIRLKNNNDALTLENEKLKLQLGRFNELQLENEHLRQLLAAVPRSENAIKTGEIIGRVPDQFTHRLIIDIGSKDGVEVGMPVIGAHGVIGQISRTVQHQSEVTLLTDHRQRLAVRNERTRKQFIVAGTGEHLIDLLFVLPEDDIRVGDKLITSGLDHLFPPNIMVGTIVSKSHKPGETYQAVSVDPSTPMNDFRFVTVLLANPKPTTELLAPEDNNTNKRKLKQ